ncbi:hypothetical protein FRB96_001203 [Tulasnella sp. 330]|nr:hypothetical protein FRB96_001203 [Tulasnella sp. 330]
MHHHKSRYAADGRPLVAVEAKPKLWEKIRRMLGMRPKRRIVYTPAYGYVTQSPSVRVTTRTRSRRY